MYRSCINDGSPQNSSKLSSTTSFWSIDAETLCSRRRCTDVKNTSSCTFMWFLIELKRLNTTRKDLDRSEEHTSELQSLMRISYAVFCLKKKNKNINNIEH